MGFFTNFLAIIGVITALIFLIIWRLQEKKGKIIEVEPNQPQIYVHAKRILPFTDGYIKGNLVSLKLNKNHTYLVKFNPTDVYQGNTQPIPETKSFIVHEDYLKEITDTGSRRRQIWIMPKDKLDLPKSIRETLMADYFTKEGQISHIESLLGDYRTRGDEALKHFMDNRTRLGFSKQKEEEKEIEFKKIKERLFESQGSSQERRL